MSFAAASDNHASESVPESVIAAMLAMLRLMAARFVAAFGDPAAMIKGGAIYGKSRERMLRWLHDMECVVRRLLLLRAALFPPPPLREPGAVKVRAARRVREAAAETLFGPSGDPALWRVSFRLPAPPEPLWMQSGNLGGFRAHEDVYHLGHRADPVQMETAPKGGAADLAAIGYWADDPRPLAERFEALRRVIEDHEHYAARLAQRLYAWRGRDERRQLFLHKLCATVPIANEAALSDEELQAFADARPLARALIPVFSDTLRPPPRDSS